MRLPIAVSLSLLFAFCIISRASADLDGHLLHRMCKEKNTEFVAGFVVGVADKAAHDATIAGTWVLDSVDREKLTGPQARDRGRTAIRAVQPFCIAKGVKLGEMTALVCKALELFPDVRKHKAAAITADALKVKWPCKDERAQDGFSPVK